MSFSAKTEDFHIMNIVSLALNAICKHLETPFIEYPTTLEGDKLGMLDHTVQKVHGKWFGPDITYRFNFPRVDLRGQAMDHGGIETALPHVVFRVIDPATKEEHTYEFSLIVLRKDERGDWYVKDLGPVTVDETYTADTKEGAPVEPALAAG